MEERFANTGELMISYIIDPTRKNCASLLIKEPNPSGLIGRELDCFHRVIQDSEAIDVLERLYGMKNEPIEPIEEKMDRYFIAHLKSGRVINFENRCGGFKRVNDGTYFYKGLTENIIGYIPNEEILFINSAECRE